MATIEQEHALDPFWYEEFDTSRPVISLVTTAVRVVASPSHFFSRLYPEGGYLTALAFGLMCTYVCAVLGGIAYEILQATLESRAVGGSKIMSQIVSLVAYFTIVQVVIAPIAVAFFHLFVRTFVGHGHLGYRATYRLMFYADAPVLWVGWIPVVGPSMVAVWSIYLAMVGVREVHGASRARAAAAILVPTVIIAVPTALVLVWGVVLLSLVQPPAAG